MMYRFNKYKKRLFDLLTRGILDTPPVVCDPDSPLVVLSQSYHADLHMYLVAAKSFACWVRPSRFVVVDDGLQPEQRRQIAHHLGTVEFIRTADVDTGACPRRGTWERLSAITRLARDHYVIQIDSDTVSLGPQDEVLRCIRERRSFTLGTWLGREVVAAREASAFAAQAEGQHVQLCAERALARLAASDTARYVRGCSGFAGFAPGSVRFEQLEALSQEMSALVGADKWAEWGSEQFSSNFLVANSPDAVVLPYERYLNWTPDVDAEPARLLHFIGDHRWKGTFYARTARRAIATAHECLRA